MMRFGLLGRSLSHSYSPLIHQYLGDYPYDLFEKEPEEISGFLENEDFTGINVTSPYKKTVLPYCDELTQIAKRLGAVNTIVKHTDGTLLGHNSDYFGFCSMIGKLGISVSGKKVLVLGSGGASATVVAALQDMGANPVVISRSGEDNYSNVQQHKDAALIVNATPVGMYPHTGDRPLDLGCFRQLEAVADLIYNPARTRLLMDAEKHGLKTENGLWMLVAQAKESAELFTGMSIDDRKINEIYRVLRQQMENIILIGMPGCGKSTVGAALAAAFGRSFMDTDKEIEKTAGCTIPEIFEKDGEPGFRKLETEVLTRLGKESGLVIATGGGCVTKEENYPLLHGNSKIIWLQRNLEKLPAEGRPLSLSGSLQGMFEMRQPLYRQFADITVSNDDAVSETVQKILNALRETP